MNNTNKRRPRSIKPVLKHKLNPGHRSVPLTYRATHPLPGLVCPNHQVSGLASMTGLQTTAISLKKKFMKLSLISPFNHHVKKKKKRYVKQTSLWTGNAWTRHYSTNSNLESGQWSTSGARLWAPAPVSWKRIIIDRIITGPISDTIMPRLFCCSVSRAR